MSARYRLPVPVFHFRPKLTLQRGLSGIAELLVSVWTSAALCYFCVLSHFCLFVFVRSRMAYIMYFCSPLLALGSISR